ncbi:MAG: S9 family peptidase [Thermoanaerobaculia bacterium]
MRSALAAPTALVLSIALAPSAARGAETPAAKKPLTLERVHAPEPLVEPAPTGFRWRSATRFTYLKREGVGPTAKTTLVEEDAVTGKVETLAEHVPAGEVAKSGALKTFPLAGAQWNESGTALLVDAEKDLWLYEIGARAARRLTSDEAEEDVPAFSPDGSKVAYVKGNDLWFVDVATAKATRLTSDGSAAVLNGKLDWVYEEELAGRNGGRAYEWAPDSSAIAFIRLDQSKVPEYPIVDFLPTNGKLMPQRYPCPGDPNATPSVHVVSWDASGVLSASAAGFDGSEVLLSPGLSWLPDSSAVAFSRMNRTQSELEVLLLPRRAGTPRSLLKETSASWINAHEPPVFLPDGSGFLFLSERSGFLHLWRYRMDGTAVGPLTTGDWAITDDPKLDAKAGAVFFTSTNPDPRERHLWRIGLDGTGLARLTFDKGTHQAIPSPGGRFVLDTWSNVDTPPRVVLRRENGTLIRSVFVPKSSLDEYALATTEMGSFRGSDGTLFYTRLVRPAGFDPKKKYPVVVYVYGGPHAQVVQERWGTTSLLDQVLASKGFLVWAMDNRGSGGRGQAFESPVLKRLGDVELKDQLEGVAELKKLPFVDPARLGLSGWSYGGFMTLALATRAPETWKAAVAGAPVTHWKYYDSIYTERYMKLPKENPEGYEATAPLTHAGKLGPKLLLLHGTADDNVHMQNSIAFTDVLNKAHKPYVFTPFAGMKHGPRDPATRRAVNERILSFLEENL